MKLPSFRRASHGRVCAAVLAVMLGTVACGERPASSPQTPVASQPAGADTHPVEMPVADGQHSVSHTELAPPKDPHYPGDETRPEWQEGLQVDQGVHPQHDDRHAEDMVYGKGASAPQ